MNAEQYAKASKAVINDSTLRYAYWDEHGHRCVIGGLCAEAGLTIPKDKREEALDKLPADVILGLQEAYGLQFIELAELQHANDMIENLEERRQGLLSRLSKWLRE